MTAKDADATLPGSDDATAAEPSFDRRGFLALGAGGLLGAVLARRPSGGGAERAAERDPGDRAGHQRRR